MNLSWTAMLRTSTKLKRDRSVTIKSGPDSKWHPFTAAPIIDRRNVDECLLTLHAKTQDKYRLRTSSSQAHISEIDFVPTARRENAATLRRAAATCVSCIFHEVVYPSTHSTQTSSNSPRIRCE